MKSLRTRILIAIVGLVLLGMGSLGLFAAQQIADSVMLDFSGRLARLADNVANELAEELEYGEMTDTARVIVDSRAQSSDFRVTLTKADGSVLHDSRNSSLPDNLFTNVALSASTTQRQLDEQGIESLWAATPIQYEGEARGAIIVSASTAEPYAEIRRRLWMLGGAFLALMVLALLLGTWLARSLTRPLQTLRDTALTLADGDLDQRVPQLNTDEMSTVGNAFNEMAAQVQGMVAEQKAFAGNAAHELRTPITAIRLRTERMLSGSLDPETVHEYITEIDSEATRMGSLVNDLTLLARLDANRLQIGDGEIDIGRVVTALIDELQPRATRKSITLTLDRPPGMTPVKATTSHVQVVFRNLLDNAIKYTPMGGSVTCQLRQLERAIVVTVRDTGEGISEADLPRVTQRFYRADQAHTREVDGIGLGLSLVTSLLAAYGGTLAISSEGIEQGTTVTATWPIL